MEMFVKRAKFPLAAVALFLFATAAFAEEGVGLVIALEGRAAAKRDGAETALALKDRVFERDSVVTADDSKLQILLDDDSAITLGPNTSIEISEFAEGGSESKFSARLAEGRSRIVTGRIAEKNPEGFRMTTKHAAIGIRGTIITVTATEEFTRVDVNNTDNTVLVNGHEVAQFNKIVVRDGAEPEIGPLAPEEREQDAGFAAGAPQDDGAGATGFAADAGNGAGSSEYAPENIMTFENTRTEPVIPTTAVASGSFAFPGDAYHYVTSLSGAFGFDIGLADGTISGAWLNWAATVVSGITYGYSAALSGGGGTASASGFFITGFSGPVMVSASGESVPYTDNNSYIDGTDNLLELDVGDTFGANVHISFNGPNPPPGISNAVPGTGTIDAKR
jgi:hypothetical protein